MSRRLSARIRRWAAEPDRLAVAVTVAGVGLAIGLVVLGSFVRYGGILVAVLYSVAALLPVVGVVIAVGALLWASTSPATGESPLLQDLEQPPERGHIESARPVADETASTLTYATSEWYRCRNGAATEKIVARLRDGTVRALRSRRGLERTAAREAVRSGTWTDDRVAAAFLADESRSPPRERRRAAIDPGAAFDRRVRRTLAAIEDIGDEPRSLEAEPDRELVAPRSERDENSESESEPALESRQGPTRLEGVLEPEAASERESLSEPEAASENESVSESGSDREPTPNPDADAETNPDPDTDPNPDSNPKTAEVDR